MKTIWLTGGNRGLGRAAAESLLGLGHRVVFTSRDAAAGERARDEMLAKIPGARVEMIPMDLASMRSIHAAVDAWERAGGDALDVLFNNAGIMQQSPERRITIDGFEETLGVNVLGAMLLTKRLLPYLMKLKAPPAARVVNVTSRLHMPGMRGTDVNFDFEDPHLERDYDPQRAYKNSKLAVLWFTYELSRRLPKERVTVNAVCPGFVPKTVEAHVKGLQRWMMKWILPLFPFTRSVAQAAAAFTAMAVDPALDSVTGKMFADGKEFLSSEDARDLERAKRFWEWANDLMKLEAWP